MTSTHSRRRAAACNYSEATQMQGSAELREIGDKFPIVRRYISDYAKLRDAIRLLRKKRKKQ